MSRHEIPEDNPPTEVPLVVYDAGRRVIVGTAVVLAEGIAAYFDADPGDGYAASVVEAITRGSLKGLSIAPTPARDATLTDLREKERTSEHPNRQSGRSRSEQPQRPAARVPEQRAG